LGGDIAIFATARKLAAWIYRLLRWGQPYLDEGVQAYEKRYHQARINALRAKGAELGFDVVPKVVNA
jgi:transposase